MIRSLWLVPALLVPLTLLPAEPRPEPPAIKPFTCHWASGPITLDGKADEAAWKAAEVIDKFSLPWLKDKARPAKTLTKARLLWDRDALYYHADMDDTDLYAVGKQRNDELWHGDVFELFFKPALDKPGYYEFQVNPQGTLLNLFMPRRGTGGYERYKTEGDFGYTAKVVPRGTVNKWQDRDQGWSVEGRIPWTDFARTGGRPAPGEEWRFALCRVDVSTDFEGPELSTCAKLDSLAVANFHKHEDYAPLVFAAPKLEKDEAPRKAISKVTGSPEPPSPYQTERRYPDLAMQFPIHIVPQPGSDRILLITQPKPYSKTRIERFVDRPDVKEPEILLSSEDTAYDITFHPKFAENGYVYVGSNGAAPKGVAGGKRTRVTRYHLDPKPPYKFDADSATVIIDWASDGHNGGAIGFGKDGLFYVTTGDGTSDSDTNLVGQGLEHLLGKVLRIDVDQPDAGKLYSVPKDNPFVGVKDARPETWAYGLRNPWRLTVDAETGAVWVGNNGQDLWEQAYRVEKGANYGWSVMEGGHPFYLTRKAGPTPFVKPTVEHHHSEARSLTGGIVTYGKALPDLRGAYVYADYSTGKIWGVRHDGTKVTWHQELVDTPFMISGFGRDTKGEMLICDHKEQGAIYTLKKREDNANPTSKFPRKLSETGLFSAVKGHRLMPELFRYQVNVQFWSDGAFKERAFYLPPDAEINLARDKAWELPNGTVTVKSFGLEEKGGKRWIETRLLLKEENEWSGFTYRWNAEQTEAELVAKEGVDATFGEQKWHYPSRSECMVCHSRASGFTLGLCTMQMNRPGADGVNQLEALERRGWLKPSDGTEAIREALRERGKLVGHEGKKLDEWVAAQTNTRDQRSAVKSNLLPKSASSYSKLPDPYAPGDLEQRSRAYLHVNCANCHVEAGGGNAQFSLEWSKKLADTKLIDVKPLHHTFDLPEARLVSPGHPERSVLLHRTGMRDKGFMPPLSTHQIDEPGVKLLRDWIAGMKP